jgi:predicted TPR repeat methyltransferase
LSTDKASWSQAVFERLYAERDDPWNFESSPYERAKYAQTLAALDRRKFARALELGCSIGVMTTALASCCDRLLAVDIAETALSRARSRCAAHAHVGFAQCQLPEEFPELSAASCDLILVSELLYFLSPADNVRLADSVCRVLATDGIIVLVNWTGATDTPCTGDEAARIFIAACLRNGLSITLEARHDGYRLDRLCCASENATV